MSLRVVGIDLSLTDTGLCRWDIDENTGRVLTVRTDRVTSKPPRTWRHPKAKKPSPPTLQQRQDRVRRIAAEVFTYVMDPHPNLPDLVVIEAPAYSSRMGSAHDRSGLWWMIVNQIIMAGLPVGEVAPSARCKYATGSGNADKDVVLAAAIKRYPDARIDNNNVADATILAAMGARSFGYPVDSVSKVADDTVKRVAWPEARRSWRPRGDDGIDPT